MPSIEEGYAIVILTAINEDDSTVEAHREFDTWDQMVETLGDVKEGIKENWLAITIVHRTDLPLIQQGAIRG